MNRKFGVVFLGLWVAGFFAPAILFAADSPTVDELERQVVTQGEAIMRLQAALMAERVRIAAEQAAAADKAALELAKKNFTVTAPTKEIARQVQEAAARTWMQSRLNGLTLAKPCSIAVKVGQVGAGGATTFNFGGGQVFGWQMNVQGSLERILDSVIPHEVCHMLNACDLRRPLPRWADEGVATLYESEGERMRQLTLAKQIVGTPRFIPVRELLTITEYPKDMQEVLALYAEGSALSDFLVTRAAESSGGAWGQERARQWMLAFIQAAHERGADAALNDLKNSKDNPLGNIGNVAQLSNEFTAWLRSGNAALYSFVADPFDQSIAPQDGKILPVSNTDNNRNVVPLSR